MTHKYKPIPSHLFTSQYQRHIGGIVSHPSKIPADVDLLALRKEMTVKEMAAKFKCSKNCVYRWISKAKKECKNVISNDCRE